MYIHRKIMNPMNERVNNFDPLLQKGGKNNVAAAFADLYCGNTVKYSSPIV